METLSRSMERAEVMVDRIAKVSAIKGDETEVSVAEWCEGDTKSLKVQPSPAFPVDETEVSLFQKDQKGFDGSCFCFCPSSMIFGLIRLVIQYSSKIK